MADILWASLGLWIDICKALPHKTVCQHKCSVLQVLFSCFMQLPCMTAYIRFCSRQLSAATFLQQLTVESPEFMNIVKQCQSDPRTNGMPLSSFLIKPMQRITKYPLLIKKVCTAWQKSQCVCVKCHAEYGTWLQLQLWNLVQYAKQPHSAAVEYHAVYATQPSSAAVECCALYAHGSIYFMHPSHV